MIRVRYKNTSPSLICPSSLGKSGIPVKPHTFLGMAWNADNLRQVSSDSKESCYCDSPPDGNDSVQFHAYHSSRRCEI
jgi:hypothetical protein